MTKLLPCPFCGIIEGEYGQPYKESDDKYTNYILCGHCEIRGESSENWDDAIENWNTRSCDKKSNDYIQGFLDAKKQMIQLIENLPNKEIK